MSSTTSSAEAEDPQARLRALFLNCFTRNELAHFLAAIQNDLRHALPGDGASADEHAASAVSALSRHGRIDRALFVRLLRERPAFEEPIAEVAALHGVSVNGVRGLPLRTKSGDPLRLTVSEVRRALLSASTPADLARVRYRVKEELARYPNNRELLEIADQVEHALKRPEYGTRLRSTRAPSPRALYLFIASTILFCVTVLLLVYLVVS